MRVIVSEQTKCLISIIETLKSSADGDGDTLRINHTQDGFIIHSAGSCVPGSLYATIRRGLKDRTIVVEFESNSPIDTIPVIVYVDTIDNVDNLVKAIINWFTVKDGNLFNVPENGSLQPFSVKRREGKAYLTPFMGN